MKLDIFCEIINGIYDLTVPKPAPVSTKSEVPLKYRFIDAKASLAKADGDDWYKMRYAVDIADYVEDMDDAVKSYAAGKMIEIMEDIQDSYYKNRVLDCIESLS